MPLYSTLSSITNSQLLVNSRVVNWRRGDQSNTVTGTASIDNNGGASLFTGSTAGSVAVARLWSNLGQTELRSSGAAAAAINFSRRVCVGGFFCCSARTANGVSRIQIGRDTSLTTAADLATRGFGIKIENDQVRIQTHDGTNLTNSSSVYTINSNNFWFLLDSDGFGNVKLYIDDTLVGTGAGGPTSAGSDGHNGLTASATNGADAAVQRLILGAVKVWLF